jgi:hypothetical protein
MSELEDKIHMAYNGAGHTIAYYHFGIPLISVTVPANGSGVSIIHKDRTIEADKKIMISLAGTSSELICLGNVSPIVNGDIQRARRYEQTEQELNILKNQIESVLKQPQYRYAIELLVNELLKKPTLAGDEAFSIIKTAFKEYEKIKE